MNYDNIDYIFKHTNTPILLLFVLINNEKMNDDNIEIILKYFFYYNDILSLKINIIQLVNKYKYSNDIVKNYYNIINKQLKILPFIKKIKIAYPYKYFWSKDICVQIEYFKKKLNLFLSYFDCSKGNITFMIKVRMGYHNSIEIIENEMIDRLIKTKKLFKLPFFKNNSIILISLENFLDLTYENKINYMDYIFISCLKKIVNYINYLELYNIYRTELENLLDPKIINIIETTDSIDIATSDIEFM